MDGVGGKYDPPTCLSKISILFTADLPCFYRPGWAWIFIIEGVATMFVGIFCWWMVFDWPDTAVRFSGSTAKR